MTCGHSQKVQSEGMQLSISQQKRLAAVCRRWPIAKLQIFGSRARGDARRNSDYDLLVSFDPHHQPSLFDLGGLHADFSDALDASVDIVENTPSLPSSILKNARTIFKRR